MGLRCGASWPYYRQRFIRAAAGRWVQWNWGAALLPLWGIYWRISPALVFYFFFPYAVAEVTRFVEWHTDLSFGKLGGFVLVGIASGLLKGLFGTRLLYMKVSGDVAAAVTKAGSAVDAIELLQKRAPRPGVVGALVHGAGTAIMLLIGIFIVGFNLTYPLERNRGYMRSIARGELWAVYDSEFRYRDTVGVWTDDAEALGLSPSSDLYLTIAIIDSNSFAAVARAKHARVVCSVEGRADRPGDPEITCSRR